MDPVVPFDWQRMFVGAQPPLFFLEIVLRVILVYGFTVIMLRLTGKRGQRQMTRFELVLVIALGSATGDTMFYPEVPILYAWLIIAVMVGLDRLLGELQFHFKKINTFLVGDPRLLLKNGRILDKSLHPEQIRRDELLGLLREQEVENTGELKYVFIEETGNLGIIRQPSGQEVDGESTVPVSYEE
ncbi:MAG: DUF421 domain-containing protein [Anaerolineae bacterium]|uniref:DUF421 domain-containing protein n=1 Tax=Promineifilum sp. TaxID=2664178 RepID=UPI001DDDB3C8|nr:DUF421 domain-containing protein [Anaerolineales bacterium]MCB8935543.1 DUF421 domain-containing protein [Promineifilum sp.]MCO5178877.1 DUF421 domain-containing protein [Promineifilum sp.]MCW5848163.1 DUF421 domain-containing protein [Anaerolineae bacterium]